MFFVVKSADNPWFHYVVEGRHVSGCVVLEDVNNDTVLCRCDEQSVAIEIATALNILPSEETV